MSRLARRKVLWIVLLVIFTVAGVSKAAQATNLWLYKSVDNPTPKAGDWVVFSIIVENRENKVESEGTVLVDDMGMFEDVQYRYRVGFWSWSWQDWKRVYVYSPYDYTSWKSWPSSGSLTLGELDRWREKHKLGGRYEIEIKAKVKTDLVGKEIVNRVLIKKGTYETSASAAIYVKEEPWSGGEVFNPYLKPIPSLSDTNLQPNVLLLLDTSGSMTFNMKDDETTYGDGSKPVKYGFGETQFYYGVDLSPDNNDPGVGSNYHPNLKYVPESEVELIKQEQGEGALNALGYNNTGESPPAGYSNYLYPNDSRMYQMKVVLESLFSDEQLISGLRVGLATYDQIYSSGGTVSDWYKFPRRYYGSYYYYEDQYLHYRTGGARALLRENFGSVDDPAHLASLIRWFDGKEEAGNPELRAQGATPLAASIYGHDGRKWNPSVDSAVKFFKAEGAIQGWCQKNYLIVLTDGADTEVGDPVEAVKKLYEEAKANDWPRFFDKKAQPVKTLVIGLIDPDSMPGLAEELNEMADVGWDGKFGNEDPSDDPLPDGDPGAYFAKDIDQLMAAFREIFKIIQSDQITGGAPMVSPSRTDVGGGAVYVASFLPQEYSQWKGHLYQYSLVSGDIGDYPEWDAGEKLEEKINSDERVVCTVDWAGTSPPRPNALGVETNLVRFSSSDAAALSDEISPEGVVLPSAFLSKLLGWVTGYDEWGEKTGSNKARYAFGDIYHGGVTEVGKPAANYPSSSYYRFAQEYKNRTKTLYAQSNAGVLHALDPTNGEEKWAFIPPNVLARGRLLGLKAYYSGDNIKLIDDAISVPRYLLDGPLVAEDVLLSDGEGWRTVLVGCLGYGGNGLYVLDVTLPEEPKFLWAVENNIVAPGGKTLLPAESRKIHYWRRGPSGSKVDYQFYSHEEIEDSSQWDYKDLYRTLSTPLLGYADSLVYKDDTGWEGRWVAIMGNGHPGDLSDVLTEGAVYLMDIGTGEVIKKLEIEGELGPVCAPVTGFSSTMSAGNVERIYVADMYGNVFSWSDQDHWGHGIKIFDGTDVSGSVVYRMDVGMIDHDPWLFYQTGDAEGLTEEATSYRLYAINTSAATEESPVTIDDLEQVMADRKDTSDSVTGWYMDFATDPLEKPTTPVLFYNGYLLFCTFEESKDPCELGTTKMYIMNAKTGEGAWKNGNKYVEIKGLHVSGITVFDGRVYLGVSGFATAEYLNTVLGAGVNLGHNLLSFSLPEGIPINPDDGSGIDGGLLFWREWR